MHYQNQLAPRRSGSRSAVLLLFSLGSILAGCDGGASSAGPAGVASIDVQPRNGSVALGAALQLSATPLDAAGNALPGRAIFWASSDTSVATVSAAGLVVPRRVGSAQIAASAGGASGLATITVAPAAAAAIEVSPATRSLSSLSDTVRFSATIRDGAGAPLPAGRAITWTSSSPGVAVISSGGVATAVGAGTTTITASADGASGTAVLTVEQDVAAISVNPGSVALAQGDTVRLAALATDAGGSVVAGAPVSWSSSNPAIATVDGAGLVRGVATGEVTVTAASGGVAATSAVAVALTPVGSVAVAPSAATVAVAATLALSATVRDERGNSLSGRSVSWSSANPAVATVSASGVVTGRAAGSVVVTAASGGRSGTAEITVPQPPPAAVASVVITPSSGTLIAGATLQFTAIARDGGGNVLNGRSVAWSSSDAAVATVSQSGAVTGRAPGTAVVSATVEGRTGTATVQVVPVPVASVSVSPAAGGVSVGASVQLSATARDSAGGALAGRRVTWSSGNTAIATVDTAGLVRGVAAGSASITAAVEGRSASATITVSVPAPAAVATVQVTPDSTTLASGSSGQLSVTLRDAAGTVLSGRSVAWASSDSTVASVSASGVVTAAAAGIATITATAEARTGTARIRVVAGAPARISLQPQADTVTAGSSRRFVAITTDAAGNVIGSPVLSWKSSNTAIATVDDSGLARGLAPGVAQITAATGAVSGSATLFVTPTPVASVRVQPATDTLVAGESVVLSATALNAAGSPLPGRTILWFTNNAAVATVDAQGRVRAVAPGAATITATSEGQSGTATIIVQAPPPAPVASVDVSPASAELQTGGTQQLSATLRDSGGNPVSGRTITWSSSNPAVAAVSTTGLVTAAGVGSVTITATAEGQSGTATITVQAPPPAPVASVQVTPASAELQTGATQQLSATPRDAVGNPLSGRSIAWSSSNPAVASVSATGLVTAAAAGSATITATSEGQSGSAAITVQAPPPAPVATVEVSPDSAELQTGGTQQLSATLRDSAGNPLSGRTVAWSSSNPAAATVSGTGLVTAFAPGAATITATAEGRSGSAAITVQAPPPAPQPTQLVLVSGDNQTGSNNQTLSQPLVVQVLDAEGRPVAGVTVTWTTTESGGAAALDPTTSVSDPSGFASTAWTLGGGNKKRSPQATATAAGLPPVQFTASIGG